MGPMVRCVRPTEARAIMQDIHSGMCAMDSGSRALLIGYYWPIVSQDTKAELKTCPKCCAYAIILGAPKHNLVPIITPWPFHRWGINVLGSFPAPPGNVKYMIGIHWATTSPYHSQANGKAEVAYREIVKGIEKHIEEYKNYTKGNHGRNTL
ncbi:NYNRIN-like protein [Tanacetum coccineum]